MKRLILATTCVCALSALAAGARAENKGETVLKAAFAKLGAAKTMTMSISVSLSSPDVPGAAVFKGNVTAMKPNFLRVELEGPVKLQFVSDGKNYYRFEGEPPVVNSKVSDRPVEFIGVWEGEVDSFFGGEASVARVKPVYAGTAKLGSTVCDVIKVEMPKPARTVVYSIGKEDSVIYKSVLTYGKRIQTNVISNQKLNVEKHESDFEFKAPKDAKTEFEPSPEDDLKQFESSLLKLGTTAPDFAVSTPEGGKLSLAQTLSGSKAVLVNFWYMSCPPCREEHPHLQRLYEKLKDKGLEMVAVNAADQRGPINRYVKDNKFTFKVGVSIEGQKDAGISTMYGVKGFPTNYILAPDGRVVYAGVSFREDKILAALATLGVK
jgi:thiol-disulfide isomerase/thioredoxin